MPKEWTDEEVQKEISEAVQIVREDRIDALIRRRLSAESANPNDSTNGDKNAPPPSSGDNSPPKRKSLWWGVDTPE
jgi:hypothetical protein